MPTDILVTSPLGAAGFYGKPCQALRLSVAATPDNRSFAFSGQEVCVADMQKQSVDLPIPAKQNCLSTPNGMP
jgi:hypothetical protein